MRGERRSTDEGGEAADGAALHPARAIAISSSSGMATAGDWPPPTRPGGGIRDGGRPCLAAHWPREGDDDMGMVSKACVAAVFFSYLVSRRQTEMRFSFARLLVATPGERQSPLRISSCPSSKITKTCRQGTENPTAPKKIPSPEPTSPFPRPVAFEDGRMTRHRKSLGSKLSVAKTPF